jgi:lysine 6-dehydrogenase
VLLDCFRTLPKPPEAIDDRDFLSVVVEGEDQSGPVEVRYDLASHPQSRPPLSAVARDTGFPPALVCRMILDGVIKERGVLPPERCVPVAPLLSALAARGMRAKVRMTRPAS